MQTGHHPNSSMASYELTKEVIKMLLYPTSGLFTICSFGGRTMLVKINISNIEKDASGIRTGVTPLPVKLLNR